MTHIVKSHGHHFPDQMSVSMSASCNWEDSQVKCLCCVTGQNPGQMSVSHDWVDAQVMSVLHNWADSQVKDMSRATGRSHRLFSQVHGIGNESHELITFCISKCVHSVL